ncbi:MAG: methyltransferase domain-containing protein [Patescibacteria group bacterium]
MSYHTGNNLVDPYLLFEKARLRSGMQVADFGAGRTGHIVFPAGAIVGETGIVYAVDVLKDVLESIKKRANMEGRENIHTVWADFEKSGGVSIPAGSLDAVFMVNVLFHAADCCDPLHEAARLLRNKSRIVAVDWMKRLSNLGPTEDKMVNFSRIIAWARDNGFGVQEDAAVSPYHRCLVLYKND